MLRAWKQAPSAFTWRGLRSQRSVATVESGLERSDTFVHELWPGAERDHAFLFVDLCGFTEYTYRHGDQLGAELALSFHKWVCELADAHRCDVVKSIGDAVMVRADNCHDALELARCVIALSAREGYLPVRVGVDVGPAVGHLGDWFGCTVNTAARVADSASPGELVMTERARAAIGDVANIRLAPRGAWRLKGLPEMQLHAAKG